MQKSVLLVGAGAAGLTAARRLAEKNYGVQVIEARDRIGGRIHTLEKQFSRPVEAGAEFIHGKQPATFALLEESKRQAILLEGNRYQAFDGAVQEGDFFSADWSLLMKALRNLEGDLDMATFLKKNFREARFNALRKRVKSFVEGYDAADLNKVSARALRDEWEESDDEHQYHVKGGYMALMRHLEEKIRSKGGRVFLSSPVMEIEWAARHVRVKTEDGRLHEGERAIITVPLGVLQEGKIRFSPALPDHRKAFEQMGFGGVIKFFYEFSSAFWEDQIERPFKDVAFIFSDAEVPTWWTQLPDKTPLVTGWWGGPSTSGSPDDPEVLLAKGIRSLEYIFKCPASDIKRAVKKFGFCNWVTDPFALGAYGYPTTKTAFAREFISRPVNDTLFFAGEALYEGTAIGTVEAALVSGEQIANKIIDEDAEKKG